jgi:ribosome-associated protein
MEQEISRSAKKRMAKAIEELAGELAELSDNDLKGLPADDALKREIALTRSMKGGARKRQVKFIARELRQTDHDEIFAYLARRKGSQLQEKQTFHELERMRDAILTEAIEQHQQHDSRAASDRNSYENTAVLTAAEQFPDLDRDSVGRAAKRYAATRKPALSREIFRLLKAAMQRLQLKEAAPPHNSMPESTDKPDPDQHP